MAEDTSKKTSTLNSRQSPVKQSVTQMLENWPREQDIDKWIAKVVSDYNDPEVKCNKITGIDSPTKGAIRVKGIWCAQDQGVGSHAMNVTVDFIGDAINKSFRKHFPSFSATVAISIWDTAGIKAFGSRDWK